MPFEGWFKVFLIPRAHNASPRQGTGLTRLNPRAQREGTLFKGCSSTDWVLDLRACWPRHKPDQLVDPSCTGLMPTSSTTQMLVYSLQVPHQLSSLNYLAFSDITWSSLALWPFWPFLELWLAQKSWSTSTTLAEATISSWVTLKPNPWILVSGRQWWTWPTLWWVLSLAQCISLLEFWRFYFYIKLKFWIEDNRLETSFFWEEIRIIT